MSTSCRNSSMGKWRKLNGVIHSRTWEVLKVFCHNRIQQRHLRVSSRSLTFQFVVGEFKDHTQKLKNNAVVRNTAHFDNVIDSSVCLEVLEDGNITPFALQMRQGVFRTFPVFKKVRSPTASAEMTRQVEISTLSAHQMAHGGVVAHSSSWTPAAYELEESSPLLDSHIGGLPEPHDGRREQGDKVVYILMCLTAGNAAGYRGGVINTGVEDILVLPAVQLSSFFLVLHFVTDSCSGSSDRCSRGVAASFWPAVAAAAIRSFAASPVVAAAAIFG